MLILRTFLIVFEVLVSVLLIGVVLLQKSREQGLGMAFGANVGESLFGSRAGNVLTKATILLGCIFAANTLLIGLLYAGRAAPVTDSLVDRIPVAEQPQTMPAPVVPAEGVTPEVAPPADIAPDSAAPATMPEAPAPDAAVPADPPPPDPAMP